MSDRKTLVQQQFGDKAEAYARSSVHAKGASLARLVELVEPQANWLALDVATAAGHTAHTFAPYVAHVVATDITPQMLPKAAELALEKGITNLSTETADAENLPFPGASFDLVTCRIAPHHFGDAARFVREAARVLRPGGRLAVVDNIVPHTRSRKKKELEAYRSAAVYLDNFEKLRDPSHHRMLSMLEWEASFVAAGLIILHSETARKRMDFDPWADRMQVSPDVKTRLRVMLTRPPKIVLEFLTPEIADDRIIFHLTEGIIIGQKLTADS